MSILPINATPQEQDIEASTSRISGIPTPLRDLWNPATCPADLLPWLAWAFTVPDWSPDWTDAQKRNVIATSVATHRVKGTVGAVKQFVESLGLGATIQEWWQKTPKGTPHTFTLNISASEIPASAQTAIVSGLGRIKPARSTFDINYVAGYLAQVNVLPIVQATVYDRFQASLN